MNIDILINIDSRNMENKKTGFQTDSVILKINNS